MLFFRGKNAISIFYFFLLVIATINSVVATTANSPKPVSVQGRTTTTNMYFHKSYWWDGQKCLLVHIQIKTCSEVHCKYIQGIFYTFKLCLVSTVISLYCLHLIAAPSTVEKM